MYENIINDENRTKTARVIALLELGLSRTEIANFRVLGAYGAIQNIYAKWQAGRSGITPTRLILPPARFAPTIFNRKFGVEIEAFGIDSQKVAREISAAGVPCFKEGYNHATRNHWKVVLDSSIKGEKSFELVSPILEGENGLEQVRIVCAVLIRLRANVNKSCGMHIHFDAANLDLKNWKNLILNYANLEDVIDSMMPIGRRGDANTYCMTMKIDNLANELDLAQTIEGVVGIFPNRFRKLNTQAYSRHKTVEFRQHSGTIEAQKIVNWITFLHNLATYSEKHLIGEGVVFEDLQKFNQPAIVDFYHNRIQDLNC